MPELNDEGNKLVIIDEDSPVESLNHADLGQEGGRLTGHVNLYEELGTLGTPGPFSRLKFPIN